MKHQPIAIVSVTSDLVTDQRVHRSCLALTAQGFSVILVGRDLGINKTPSDRPYRVIRFKLWFKRGVLFYATYNMRLFFFLLFNKADLLFANDLDTLPANYFAGKLKGLLPVYDSHEYYTGVPELENRPAVKKIWKFFERMIFPKLKTIITVNDSIAGLYEKEYNKKLIVIRNVPIGSSGSESLSGKEQLRKELNLPAGKHILILQGSGINIERGAEEAVASMEYLEDTLLIILGGGDVLSRLQSIVSQMNLGSKVLFLPRMSYTEMMRYTRASDIGLTFDKDTNLNYRFSLPNKIFDYVRAGIPVLASRLPEVEKVITEYEIGDFIPSHDEKAIAEKIREIFSDEERFVKWNKNLKIAAAELNWETEVKKFPDLINEL